VSECDDKKPVVEDLSQHRLRKLEAEHQALKSNVAEMMQRLHENEQLFAKLFDLEAKVLAAVDMESFCFKLLRELRGSFELDMVRLWLDGGSFMGSCRFTGLSKRDVVWLDDGEIERIHLDARNVWLLDAQSVKDFPWLSERDHDMQSMALLVLGRDAAHAFAVLGLGSKNGARFSPDQASDFLRHLAQIVSVTLENSFVREQVARLSVTDHVTGEYNQRFFQPNSQQPLSKWFGKVMVSCLCVGLTGMTKTTREAALLRVHHAIRGCIRVQDMMICMDDMFLVFLPCCPSAKAEEIADKMVQGYQDEQVSLDVGVACSLKDDDQQVRQVVDCAKKRMFVAQALDDLHVEAAALV